MGFNAVVYVVKFNGERLVSILLNDLLIYILVMTITFLIFCMYFYNKKHKKIMARKIQESVIKENRRCRATRDAWIDEQMKFEDKITSLRQQNKRLEKEVTKLSKSLEDKNFASKRRAKKIKKMEIILKSNVIESYRENFNEQLENPNCSMSSIIKSYDFSKIKI